MICEGDEVLVIAKVLKVTDCSQSFDLTVQTLGGQVLEITDAEIVYRDAEPLIRRAADRSNQPNLEERERRLEQGFGTPWGFEK